MNEDLVRTIWIIAIAATIFIIYVVYVCVSFYFMHNFKKRIENGRQAINVVLYQKFQTLDTVSDLLIKIGYDNPKLIEFDKLDEFKKYTKIDAKDFEGVFNYSEGIYMLVKSVCVNLKRSDDLNDIKALLKTIDSLNYKYFESIQLYNTNIVGFNYWRNLFFTKWIKVLFRKDEMDTIK
jgi:hypothetical protein